MPHASTLELLAPATVTMPDLTSTEWLLAAVAAVGIGIAKSGFAGVSLLYVVIFAFIFGARQSTGVVLLLLLVGDIGAVTAFRQHARWDYIWRMLPPACVGVVMGSLLLGRLSEEAFRPTIGSIILALTALQLVRMFFPRWLGDVPHTRTFAWAMGLAAGITSMLANASGPIIALYALAVGLPKLEFVGTNAWFFLIINAFKVPFSYTLGLIRGHTLLLNLALAPPIALGILIGRWLAHRVPQHIFNGLLLAFAAVAALRLVGLF
jgi:uncharacterized membrane protein YfcA